MSDYFVGQDGLAQGYLEIYVFHWVICILLRNRKINCRHLPVWSSHLMQPSLESPLTFQKLLSLLFQRSLPHLSGKRQFRPHFSQAVEKPISTKLEVCPKNLEDYLRDISATYIFSKTLPKQTERGEITTDTKEIQGIARD